MKASERIYAAIQMQISSGLLLPGDPIDEEALSLQFDVSRTPVREAVLRLRNEGLASLLPRGGVVVAKMDYSQLFAMWELMAELEGVCARYACERMTRAERNELVKAHRDSESCVEQDDELGWREANKRFHEILYSGARNPFLRDEIIRMRTRTQVYRQHAFGAIGRLRVSYDGHARIVRAITDEDPLAAARAGFQHLSPGDNAPAVSSLIMNLPRELMG